MSVPTETWQYDEQHPEGFNTLKGDNLELPESDLPIHEQRKRSQTSHKQEKSEPLVSITPEDAGEKPEAVLQRRRSSVHSNGGRRRSSRKATGSFGGGDGLNPLSSLTSSEKKNVLESGNNPLYFTNGLPASTSGH